MTSQVAKETRLNSFGLHPYTTPADSLLFLKGFVHPLAGQPLQLLPRDYAYVPEILATENFDGNVDATFHAVVDCLPCSIHHCIYVTWVACQFPTFTAIVMCVSIPFHGNHRLSSIVPDGSGYVFDANLFRWVMLALHLFWLRSLTPPCNSWLFWHVLPPFLRS